MRRLACLLALLTATGLAHAQSGVGGLRGVVLPIREGNIGGFGDWDTRFAAATRGASQAVRDAAPVPTLTMTLTPIHALRPGTHTTVARGMYGRYDFGRVSMGRYRLRVEADGCTPYETEVVILSDSQSVQHVALTCAWASK